MLNKQIDGKYGEDIAVEYLRKKGFKIIDRNFRIRGGEIDIVAIDSSTSSGQADSTLVFVEVKTRKSSEFGTPFEAITSWKLRTLMRAAEFYKVKHPKLPEAMRIDAVAVLLDNQSKLISVEQIKNISS